MINVFEANESYSIERPIGGALCPGKDVSCVNVRMWAKGARECGAVGNVWNTDGRRKGIREKMRKWPDIDCKDYSVFSTNNSLGDEGG